MKMIFQDETNQVAAAAVAGGYTQNISPMFGGGPDKSH